MTNDTEQKIASLKIIRWVAPLSSLAVALGLYFFLDFDFREIVIGALMLTAFVEFFVINNMIAKSETDKRTIG